MRIANKSLDHSFHSSRCENMVSKTFGKKIMIRLILIFVVPSVALGVIVAVRTQSIVRGIFAGAGLQVCLTAGAIALLVLNGDPAASGARTITKEELELLGASSEQNIRQVSPEAARSASPDEPSM